MVNDAFLGFLNIKRKNVIGQTVPNTILAIFKDSGELLVGIQEALQGRDFSQDINIEGEKEKYFFKIKIMPTTFEDGRHGATIIIKNTTNRMLAENALRESEQNLRNLLKKMDKK